MAQTIADQVKVIVCRLAGVAEFKANDRAMLIDDLGMDSLEVVELTQELEEHFNIHFLDGDESKLVTVKNVITRVEDLVREANAPEPPGAT